MMEAYDNAIADRATVSWDRHVKGGCIAAEHGSLSNEDSNEAVNKNLTELSYARRRVKHLLKRLSPILLRGVKRGLWRAYGCLAMVKNCYEAIKNTGSEPRESSLEDIGLEDDQPNEECDSEDSSTKIKLWESLAARIPEDLEEASTEVSSTLPDWDLRWMERGRNARLAAMSGKDHLEEPDAEGVDPKNETGTGRAGSGVLLQGSSRSVLRSRGLLPETGSVGCQVERMDNMNGANEVENANGIEGTVHADGVEDDPMRRKLNFSVVLFRGIAALPPVRDRVRLPPSEQHLSALQKEIMAKETDT